MGAACLFCAMLTGSVRAAAPAAPPDKPKTVTDYCTNEACHTSLISRKVMHGPTAQKKCQACHQYDEPREHRFKFASDRNQLCGDCHTLQHRTVVHTPVKQGNCTGCHDPHGSDYRGILKADPTRGLCLTCHQQDAFAKKKFQHGPVAAGACILCHEPHSSWQAKLLTQAPDKLCTECHAEMIPKAERDRHVHEPVKQGNCTGCHDAHASDVKFQLVKAIPDLCLDCHKQTKEMLASSHVVHGAMTETGGCSACHAPHFSQLPKLQKASQPEACLSCHDKPLKTADGQVLANMAALLKDNPQHHGPIREGDCTTCHQPHAGERFRLLVADYPPEFYASFKLEQYGLCFKCHIPDLVLKKEGTGLTRFRKGDLNLHFVHVNQQKGRTCRACHEVHASQRPFHIREKVPFGNKGWELEINFQQTPTGGTCTPGCHNEANYDHGGSPKPGTLPTTRETKNETAAR
jgi:predicted CXXCH cytochrome family protein